MKYSAVILAAGKGVRMCSLKPKVVHKCAGKAIIAQVVDSVMQAGIEDILVVVGHGREMVKEALAQYNIRFVNQEEQLGTGHALLQAQAKVNENNNILVLAGDIPLIQAETIMNLVNCHDRCNATATVLSTQIDQPYGYGRILRTPDNSFSKIVEEKDATEQQKLIDEINSGIYCFNARAVFAALANLNCSNVQGEYYLTDVLEILKNDNQMVKVMKTDSSEDIYGINDRIQLHIAEKIMRKRKTEELMRSGVTIVDPASTFIDRSVIIGQDTVILPYTIIEGETVIGERCEIGPATRISNSTINNEVVIESSRINSASVGDSCMIGPYAYLRAETVLCPGVKIGDFVEVKKSVIGTGSKIPHLSYIGDAKVGTDVNIGAGTITCNYDGINKWETILEDEVFIGSNTNLVAPVKIGKKSVTGAGSTITRDIPPNALGVERANQRNIENWALKRKEK